MYLPRRKTARAFIYDPEQKLFLVAKSAMPPFNQHLPSGGIATGEPAEQALCRELNEELGITSENIISIEHMHQVNTWVMCIPHSEEIFLVKVKNLDLKLSWEIAYTKWMNHDEIKTLFPEKIRGAVDFLIEI